MNIEEAVAAVAAGTLTEHEAVMAVSPTVVEAALHAQFDGRGTAIATGIGASPGAAVGQVYFDVEGCLDGADRGELVILASNETSPADEIAMRMAEGIITAKGGIASHAAVVARGWGIPAVCGANSLTFSDGLMHTGGETIAAGDTISLDGGTGEIFLGDLVVRGGGGSDALDTLLGWADAIRSDKVGIRANADSAADALQARSLGAEGIGLCRTEHMFLGERLPLVQNVILAANDQAATRALDALGEMQRSDFVELLEAMDGLPVTIRLLDPPMHEFLPDATELAVAEAMGTLDAHGAALATAVHHWSEQNPMLGTRGVRLAIVRDGLYRMQVRSILRAIAERTAAGGTPIVGIMIPLVSDVAELEMVKAWIAEELETVDPDTLGEILVGTMIETPRAALTASQLAPVAEFFSFGTNDLTQLTWGFSRDDVEARVISRYQDLGILDANPFERLDRIGVGALVASAIASGREANPDLEIGVCGEHGGDPSSIEFFVGVGIDYVSCSPYRVPIARLALAQAIGVGD
ncbi:MAG: PEP-utilizing enzyme [Acidimicrobiales bacterium]|jgi:pyruvate,orthophosphate dikinase